MNGTTSYSYKKRYGTNNTRKLGFGQARKWRKALLNGKRKSYNYRSSGGSKVINRNVLCSKIGRSVYQSFPDKMCVSLKNDISLTWTGTTGAINAYIIDANNLHNSAAAAVISGANGLTTGSSTNIYGLGNLLSTGANSAGIYNQYRIISSKIRVQTQNSTSATTDSALLITLPLTRASATALGNVNTFNQNILIEYPFAKFSNVSGQTMNNGLIHETAMSTAKIYGLEYRSSLEDPAYSGAFGTALAGAQVWC